MSLSQKLFGIKAAETDGERPVTWRDSLAALRYLPPFLLMVWKTAPGMTLANLVLRMLQAGIPVASLYVGKLIIDAVVQAIGTGVAGPDLWGFVGLEAALVLGGSLMGRAIALLDALLGDRFSIATSVQLMQHAARLDLQQFEDPAFYDKMERARQQTTPRVVLLSLLLSQVQDLITVSFLAAGLLAFNPWLLLLMAAAVTPSFLGEAYFNRQSYSLSRSWTPGRRTLDYLRFVGASDTTAKEVKMFGLSDFLVNEYRDTAEQQYLENRSLTQRRAFWGFVLGALGDAAYYAAYVLIIGQAIGGSISLGDLTFLAGAFARLRGMVQAILLRVTNIAQTALYLQDLFEFFAIEPMIRKPEQAIPFPETIQQGFVFENVGFKYPNSEKWAVRGLNFTLRADEKLALVGENGAGKTTLVKLLARLYEPTEGRILLDGHDLRAYDPESVRRAVGVIFQDFVKYYFSASDNLAVGQIDRRADRPRIEGAAERSLARSVIDRLPKGYDTVLGRRFNDGVDLSGGEWQKMALGRAYMREAQLLILDEPTAALDARAEYEVFERFAELTHGRPAVLISHRFSTVRMADRILVLRQGQQVELGSHEELLAHGGLYSELFLLQAQGYR
jgi:ATP-binding cassette subfamily B protein